MDYREGTFSAEQRERVITQPKISDVDVKLLMHRVYGLDVIDLYKLDGYDDVNYHVTVSGSWQKDGYVLKVLNSYDSAADQFHDAHVKMILCLQELGINCPKITRNLQQSCYSKEIITKTINGENVSLGPYGLLLFTFESGMALQHVNIGQDALLYQMGQLMGDIHVRLKNFRHDGLMEHRVPMLWQLEHFLELVNILHCIEDSKKRALVLDVVAAFMKQKEAINQLPKGPLHADVNETNVLFKCDSNECLKISCLLDFSDSHYGVLVYDVAVSIVYAMLQCQSMDSLDVGVHLIAGYLSRTELEATEFNSIRTLVGVRFAMTLVIGAYRAQREADNKNNLLATTGKRGWEVFENFWKTSENSVQTIWKKALCL